jgi:hypothetical protein
MKFDFDKITRFLGKHKLVVFLAVFLAFILLFRTRFVIEGLTSMGEYEYLAPVPPGNTISDEVVKAFLAKYSSVTLAPTPPPENLAANKNSLQGDYTEKELQNYIDNGTFSFNTYILNFLNSHADVKAKITNVYGSLDNAQKNFGSRIAYRVFILPIESKMNPPPLSYQIYMGTAQPPPAIPAVTVPSSSSSTTDKNYQDFLSLCRRTLQ